MKGAISRNELWDLVVLDPPKLAPRKKVLHPMKHLVVEGRRFAVADYNFIFGCEVLKHAMYIQQL